MQTRGVYDGGRWAGVGKVTPLQRSMAQSARARWLKSGGAEFTREMQGHVWTLNVKPDGVVTVAQSALLLGVAAMTIHRWIEEGLLKLAPRQTRVQAPKVVNLAQLRRVATEKGLFVGAVK